LVEFACPLSDIDKYVDAFNNGEEVHFRTLDNLVNDLATLGLAIWLLSGGELSSSAQKNHPCLRKPSEMPIGGRQCWR